MNNKTKGNWRRLGITFQTDQSNYFYDTGTQKVFACEENEFFIMENIMRYSGLSFLAETGLQEKELQEALESIKSLVEKENILRAPVYQKFCTQEIERTEEISINQVILELTEQCNLRCRYCIYGDGNETFRDFSSRSMTWETAKKALDYVFAHSEEDISITFYGGEPLLQFDLMKQCIDYSVETMGSRKELHFGFTTNLTLVTKEMAEYFASLKSCSIVGSLDGPEEIHNANRIMLNQAGSFEKAVQGLKLLVDCMGQDRAGKVISINAVLTPPYNLNKIEQLNQFFRSLSWLPEKMTIRTSYVEMPRKQSDIVHYEKVPEIKGTMQNNDVVGYWKLEKIRDKKEDEIKFGMDNANLIRIHQRLITDAPIPFLKQNGCCNPGNRRLYITTQGKFQVCERIGRSPVIGDIDCGINMEAIEKYYIDEYAKASMPDCSSCWASQLCSLCYAAFYSEDGIYINIKIDGCAANKHFIKNDLISYHQILESNPDYIEQNCNVEMK